MQSPRGRDTDQPMRKLCWPLRFFSIWLVMVLSLPATIGLAGSRNPGCRTKLDKPFGINFSSGTGSSEEDWREELLRFPEFKSILFLSDGGVFDVFAKSWPALFAGPTVARMFPKRAIVSSDRQSAREIEERRKNKSLDPNNPAAEEVFPSNFSFVRADNTRRLPFNSSQFQLIVLFSGLCECDGRGRTCAGILTNKLGTIQKFLKRLARVLDATPGSTIYLSKFSRKGAPLNQWVTAFERSGLSRRFLLQVSNDEKIYSEQELEELRKTDWVRDFTAIRLIAL